MLRILSLYLLLAGCATGPDPAEVARQDAARQQAYRERIANQCRAYGFTPGTDQFRGCLMQVDMTYRQQDEALRQQILNQYIQQQGIFRR